MGLGGTAKKLQKVAGMAEDLYKRMNEVVSQLKELQSELEQTSAQVNELEQTVTEQRALLEALAAKQGVDVDAVLAEVEAQAEPTAEEQPEATAED